MFDHLNIKFKFLDKLSTILYSYTNIESILSDLLELTAEYTEASLGSVCIVNPDSFFPEVIVGYPVDEWDEEIKKFIIKEMELGKGIVKKAINEGEDIIIKNLKSSKEAQFIQIREHESFWIAAILMKFKDKIIGVLHLEGEKRFNNKYIDIMQIATSHSAIALHNYLLQKEKEIKLEKKYKKSLDDINIITKMITASDNEEACIRFFDCIKKIIKTSYISVWLCDNIIRKKFEKISEEHVLVILATDGYPQDKITSVLNYEDHIIGDIITSKKAYFIPNVIKEKRYIPKKIAKILNLNRLFVVPLVSSSGNPIGSLNVYPANGTIFDEECMNHLKDLANPFSTVLELANLHQLEKQFKSLTHMSHLDSYESLNEFLMNFCSEIKKNMNVEACSFFLFDKDKKRFILRATTGMMNGKVGFAFYQKGEGITGSVGESGKIFRTHNLESFRTTQGKYQEVLTNKPARSFIVIPLLNRNNDVLGVFRCVNKNTKMGEIIFFSKDDQDLLEHISSIIASIVENMELASKFKETSNVKERLLADLEHEIIQPISGIIAHSEYLGVELIESMEKQNRSLKEIEKIQIKVKDILSSCYFLNMLARSSRIPDERMILDPEKVDFYTDILFLCKLFILPRAKARFINIEIGDSYKWNLPMLYVDKLRFFSVFFNLLQNAIKYSYDGNSSNKNIIKIILIEKEKDKEERYIDIINYGIGIKNGEENLIFKREFQGSNIGEKNKSGQGLGLYKSKLILNKSNCDIFVLRNTSPTIFRLRLNKEIFR